MTSNRGQFSHRATLPGSGSGGHRHEATTRAARSTATLTCLLIGCIWFFPMQSASNAALVAYWNFNEGSGTTAADFSPNGNDGTLGGNVSPNWVAGHTGGAGDFALNFPLFPSTTWVRVPASASFDTITSQFTIATWVRETGTNYYGNMFITKNEFTGAGLNRRWYWQNGSGGDQQNYVGSDFGTGWNAWIGLGGASALPLNEWRHIALTYDENGGATRLKLYHNGVLVGQYNFGGATFPAFSHSLFLGGPDSNGGNFIGQMDDIVFFNTIEDITSIMNGTHPEMNLAPVPEPDTLLLAFSGALAALGVAMCVRRRKIDGPGATRAGM